MRELTTTTSRNQRIGFAEFTVGGVGVRLLQRTTQLGLAGLELMIHTPDHPYLCWTPEQISHFLQHARAANISLPSVALSVFNGDPAPIQTPPRQAAAVDLIARSLRFTAAVGARHMLLCTYFASDPDTPEKQQNLLNLVKQVLPLAAELDVSLALESPLAAPDLIEMVDTVQSEYFGVYYDIGNAIYLGYDPAAEIQQLGHRILAVHVKDTAKTLGDSRLGAGRVDLHACMASLDRINYQGWLILESPGGDDDALRRDVAVLRQYINSVRENG
jgi:L-ribulose-5-phosphate 3-epimerase